MHSAPPTRSHFPDTRWSLVIDARGDEHTVRALEELSCLYWLPLYAYARRKGLDPQDAEDLTQEFFLKLIEEREKLFGRLDPAHGRLRTFFLTVMQRRIADWRRHRLRRKRGSGMSALGIEAAEALLAEGNGADLSAEASYDRQWALSVLELALGRLERDYQALGRDDEFRLLRPFLGLGEETAADYDTVQKQLGVTRDALRQKAHRFRLRFRAALRSEIADTIRAPDEAAIDAELRELQEALR